MRVSHNMTQDANTPAQERIWQADAIWKWPNRLMVEGTRSDILNPGIYDHSHCKHLEWIIHWFPTICQISAEASLESE